jgi:hypothetical protein
MYSMLPNYASETCNVGSKEYMPMEGQLNNLEDMDSTLDISATAGVLDSD